MCTTHDWRLIEVDFDHGHSANIYTCLVCDQEKVDV